LDQDELDPNYRVRSFPESIAVSSLADKVMSGIPATRLSAAAVFTRLKALLPIRMARS
jgi:hypothetical protein